MQFDREKVIIHYSVSCIIVVKVKITLWKYVHACLHSNCGGAASASGRCKKVTSLVTP